MDLFTSLALRSLGAANEVAALRPSLFASDLSRSLPEGIEQVQVTADAEPRTSPKGIDPTQITTATQPPTPPRDNGHILTTTESQSAGRDHAVPTPPPEPPTSSHTSAQAFAPTEFRMIDSAQPRVQATDERPASRDREVGEALRPPQATSRDPASLAPPVPRLDPRERSDPSSSDYPPTIREITTREIHTREVLTPLPATERTAEAEREIVHEVVRELVAARSTPSPLVAPLRTSPPSLLIPSIAPPRPPALSPAASSPQSQAPVIQVTIGRVEVSAVPSAQPARSQPKMRDTRPDILLNDYLRDPKARPQ